MKIILIRHGKTEGNLQKRYIGRTDEVLCIEGQRELVEVSKKLEGLKIDRLYSSPMKRCVETASILFPELMPELNIVEDFRETDFGDFEGKCYDELKDNPDYMKWIESNGTCGFPGGETREQAALRSVRGFEKLILGLEKDSNKFLTVAAVVHGGTVMALLSEFMGGDFYDYQIKNGEGFVFDCKCENGRIKIENLRKL